MRVLPEHGQMLDLTHPVAHKLVGYWPLLERTGSVANDISVLKNNGVLTSAPTWQGGGGGVLSCLKFDGSTNYFEMPDKDVYSPATARYFSVSCWIRFDALATVCFVGKGTSSNYEWYVGRDATRGIEFGTWTAAGLDFSCGSYNITPVLGQWYHVVGTVRNCDTSSPIHSVYVDGVLRAVNTLNPSQTRSNGTSPVRVGQRPDNAAKFNGAVTNLMIWNRELTLTDVQQLYNDPYLLFDEQIDFAVLQSLFNNGRFIFY